MAPEMPWVGLQSDKTLHEGVRTQNCKGGGESSQSPQESQVLSWDKRKAWNTC